MAYDLPLGASTWCFAGLLPPEMKAAVDGQGPLLPEYAQPVREYFAELVDAVLDSEIKSIELWSGSALRDECIIAQLRRLADAGRISSAHAPFGEQFDLSSLDEEIRRAGVGACLSAAQFLSQLGGRTLVVHGSSAPMDPTELSERMNMSAQAIVEIADRCRKWDVNVAVELLAGQQVGNSAAGLLSVLGMARRPNVGVCLDVNHVFPPDRLVPTVHSLGPRILTLHVSDYDGIEEKHWLPTQGIIGWADFIRALREVEYPGPFMYEARFQAADVRETVSMLDENYRKTMR